MDEVKSEENLKFLNYLHKLPNQKNIYLLHYSNVLSSLNQKWLVQISFVKYCPTAQMMLQQVKDVAPAVDIIYMQ